MMKLTYELQRKIDDAIIEVLNAIGQKCRGRIEIDDGDNNQIIEFESNEKGKWQRTNWHHKSADEAFSIFREYTVDLPLLAGLKQDIKARGGL